MLNKYGAGEPFEPVPFLDVPFGLADPAQAIAMDGLTQLNSIMTGELPAPTMAGAMNQWIVAAEKGVVEFRGNPSDAYLNPMGIIHGGWVMTLLDTVLGCAVQTTLKQMYSYVSTGTEVKFVRAITPKTGQVRAIGSVESRGSQIATASAHVHDVKGRLLATGTTTCLLRKLNPRS